MAFYEYFHPYTEKEIFMGLNIQFPMAKAGIENKKFYRLAQKTNKLCTRNTSRDNERELFFVYFESIPVVMLILKDWSKQFFHLSIHAESLDRYLTKGAIHEMQKKVFPRHY